MRIAVAADSQATLSEILDAWFAAGPSADAGDGANLQHFSEIEDAAR